jgi:hypothetical protein
MLFHPENQKRFRQLGTMNGRMAGGAEDDHPRPAMMHDPGSAITDSAPVSVRSRTSSRKPPKYFFECQSRR